MSISSPYRPSPLGYGSPLAQLALPTARVSRLALAAATRDAHGIADQAGGLEIREAQHADEHPRELDAQGAGALEAMASPPPRPGPPSRTPTSKSLSNGNALAQLQPAQVRTLRDGFQILDRDCDGVVNRDDVADMLSQLGLPNGPSDVSPFFPPSRPQTIALAAFLNSLAEALAALSPSGELLSAFSAFDDDDSGQVDWAELRDALLNTAPEPGERPLAAAEVDKVVAGYTGRRAFNRNMTAQLGAKRGEVFKYHDFVSSIMGSNGGSEGGSQENSED